MSLTFSSSSFLDDPFLNDSFFIISDLIKARMDGHNNNKRTDSSGSTITAGASRPEVTYIPRMDIHESKGNNEVTVTFEMPGMKKDDVTIDIHQNRLRVSGHNRSLTELDEEGYRHRERRVGRFVRTIGLPDGIKPTNVKVRMENGILMVRFPRSSAEDAPKSFKLKDFAKL